MVFFQLGQNFKLTMLAKKLFNFCVFCKNVLIILFIMILIKSGLIYGKNVLYKVYCNYIGGNKLLNTHNQFQFVQDRQCGLEN